MSKLRLLYIASLALMGALLVFTFLRPAMRSARYSEVQRAQLLETPQEWVVQLDIINRQDRDTGYRIEVEAGGKHAAQSVIIMKGRMFTYIYHINRDALAAGQATFTIYRDGQEPPIERLTYFLANGAIQGTKIWHNSPQS